MTAITEVGPWPLVVPTCGFRPSAIPGLLTGERV